ncbi:MAG: SCO family protein [Crocinitomicaceae bacterium]|nr:SCO family protein [Crocinitomicaceae bacterium]
MKQIKCISLLILLLISQLGISQEKKAACCVPAEEAKKKDITQFSIGGMKKVPNIDLITQYGEKVTFYELIQGKVVALNFVFTTCTTICPPMGANFVHLKKLMSERVESSELVMLTISIDPATDTPERLAAWSESFEPGEGWTLLTGKVKDINGLLKKLEVYTSLKEEHAPIVLMGKEGEDNWVRANGLADPRELAATLNQFFDAPVIEEPSADQNYFTDVVLLDQNGESKKLYTDLMKGKVVIINPFFTECTGVCPVMNENLKRIQEHLGTKLGTEVNIISLTVDYETDTPKALKKYADEYGAQDGWYFITGEKDNIEFALQKLGKKVESREAHDSVFLVGNLNTKLWKKVNGLAPIDDIIEIIDSVINDNEN